MKFISFLIFISISYIFNCTSEGTQTNINNQNQILIEKVADIPLPKNYKRIVLSQGSFSEYLREFPVNADDDIVNTYNGGVYWNQNTHYVILDLSVGNRDLQQCADAVMRFRAEYLYKNKDYSKIHFNFTNGERVNYEKYAQGYRVSINNNRVNWIKKSSSNYSYPTFLRYMDLIFSYAGTYSLSREMNAVANINTIIPGDVFIESKQPYGHAVIVMDVAEHVQTKERIFLIAQSYMPAQDVHILVNPKNKKLSPWYSANFENELYTPEWTFDKKHLKRFE